MSLQVTAPFLWTAATIFPVVCTALVGARFAVRHAQRGKRRLDDWLTLPALVLIWGMAAAILAGTAQQSLGFPTPLPAPGDNPLTTITPQTTIVRKVYTAMTLLNVVSLAFIKISCMLFFRRIFRTGQERVFDTLCYGYIFLTLAWCLSFFFSFLFLCGTNFSNIWGTVAQEASCQVSFTTVDQGLSYMDLILDVLILIFPLPYIWRLRLDTTRKLLVSFIFFLGSLAVLASIGRVVIVVLELNAIFDETADQDLIATAVVYFMFLECCFALCAACLPSLSGLFKLKSVQHLVAGFSNMLSSFTSSKKGSRLDGSERHSKKAPGFGSVSEQSEPEVVLTTAAAGSGKADTWVSNDREADIEMAPHVPDNRIQVDRSWELSRE